MYLFKRVNALQHYITEQHRAGKKIGFVPTMGALHNGHLELIRRAMLDVDMVVCSIFVNPTQFDDKEDLKKYPRPVSSDIEKLEKQGCCDVLFLPTVDEVYPSNLASVNFDLGTLDKTMEGAHRDGHFQGVVQVVHRLLDIVKPDALYMGQKDFQQFTIIKSMLRQMDSPIKLVRVPIVRESDGLALSSRNVRLSPEGRQQALNISKTLFAARENSKTMTLEQVKTAALENMHHHQLDIDYFEVVNGDTLQEVQSFDEAPLVVACTTVRVDGVRLLDNMVLKED